MGMSWIITIDGPTASGKGTVAHWVADKLGFHVLDSGALYRLTALAALEEGVAADDVPSLTDLAANLQVQFADYRVWLNGVEVSDAIRAEQVGNLASAIAVHAPLRAALVARQRAFAQPPGLVADGRDMGTVIFPEADLKVFLTASVEERARRRYNQLINKGISANVDALLLDLQQRDERDRTRAVAPLVPAPGAVLLDTSAMSAEDAAEFILAQFAQLDA
ncbi:(d)CMP kinase [Parvibium lacunae]|uniref:Cytidylate kinase n=2 Tax=Parvibium lacunae TaxID=1888893 RepID=A0A368L4J4_9BURK|nr:(d)CMP kinase [Parvibium lacunae]